MKQIDVMVKAITKIAGPHATNAQVLSALRKSVYESGEWNSGKPFSYDHNDPFGKTISNRLLATYLETRRGNCVSMPVLFLILGQRLGLNVTASTAPMHVFVKYTDNATGKAINLETTSGGHPARDVWYRQNLPMRSSRKEWCVSRATEQN